MDWSTLFHALPKIICFCIKCEKSLEEVQLLWVVDVTCWCPRCFDANFQFQIARGLLVHKDTGYIPSIPENSIHILMAKTKIISSSATQMETLPSMVIFKEGTYYPVYANIYKFPNGDLTSAMLLTNGRFVAVGAVVVARHDEDPSTQENSSNASTQTVDPVEPQPSGVTEASSLQGDAQSGAVAQTPGVPELSGLTPCLDKTVPKGSEVAASEDGDVLCPSVEDG